MTLLNIVILARSSPKRVSGVSVVHWYGGADGSVFVSAAPLALIWVSAAILCLTGLDIALRSFNRRLE